VVNSCGIPTGQSRCARFVLSITAGASWISCKFTPKIRRPLGCQDTNLVASADDLEQDYLVTVSSYARFGAYITEIYLALKLPAGGVRRPRWAGRPGFRVQPNVGSSSGEIVHADV
jgi:hypothetical protein